MTKLDFNKFLLFSYPIITIPALKDQFQRNYEGFAGPLRTDFEENQIEAIFNVSKICDENLVRMN